MFRSSIVVLFFSLLLVGSNSLMAQNDISADIDKLEKFLRNLDRNYVDSVSTSEIIEAGMKRMLEELDPHSVYLDKEAYERANEPLKGKFKGIGVRFMMVNDTMTILEVIEDGGAIRSRIKAGDQIVTIDGDTVSGRKKSSGSISRMIKKSEKPQLAMQVVRLYPSRQDLQMDVVRNEVQISSVPAAFMIDNRTGYIKLNRFSASSLGDFRNGLDKLQENRLKNLILDLRGNGGGYLNVAIKIADEFLDDRKLIVYTQGLHQDKRETFASSGGRYTDGALYVLVDANSASASEILAGAIQDLDRGLIVGRRSYGKGLVQRTVDFNDGSAMRLTISRYYTPTGRSIQRPYDDGVAAYRNEVRQRVVHGELSSEDSIALVDSMVYFTPLHRKVYGGGGIIPDVFVPQDTSKLEDVVARLFRKALLEGFAMKTAILSGDEIRSNYASMEKFIEEFQLDDETIGSLNSYSNSRGVEVDVEELAESESLKEFVMVPLARFIYGKEAYYQARAAFDADVLATLHEIEAGTVKELGLR